MNTLLINQYIAKTNVHLNERKYLVALGISRAIAYGLILPTSPVDSPSKYFVDNFKDGLDDQLSKINEVAIINIQETQELILKIWKMRYDLVFNSLSVDVQKLLDCRLIKGDDNVPNVYTDTINAVGVDTVNAFLNDMACALNASDEV